MLIARENEQPCRLGEGRDPAATAASGPIDVSQVLSYDREKLAQRNYLVAAFLIGLGILALNFIEGHQPLSTIAGWGLIVAGIVRPEE